MMGDDCLKNWLLIAMKILCRFLELLLITELAGFGVRVTTLV